jgi:hypothetical protein
MSAGDDTKMDLTEIGCGGLDWVHLAQDRGQWGPLMNTVINKGNS